MDGQLPHTVMLIKWKKKNRKYLKDHQNKFKEQIFFCSSINYF